jgi:hypothetical protein
MWWGIGIGGFILYVLLFFFPLLWLIGAFLQPSPQAA